MATISNLSEEELSRQDRFYRKIAEESKVLGNKYYDQQNYKEAYRNYDHAIKYYPEESEYYGLRGTASIMVKNYREALPDMLKAIQLNPNYQLGHIQLIRIYMALGAIFACDNAIYKAMRLSLTPSNYNEVCQEIAKLNQLKQHIKDIRESKEGPKDYFGMVKLIDDALKYACDDLNLKIEKLDVIYKLGRIVESGELAKQILRQDKHCVKATIITALLHYKNDELDQSIKILTLELYASHYDKTYEELTQKFMSIKNDRDKAAALYKIKKFKEAKMIYFKLLNIVCSAEMRNILIESKLHFNLSLVAEKLGNYDESLQHTYRATFLRPKYLKAHVHRANIHAAKKMYKEAAVDFKAALILQPKNKVLLSELKKMEKAEKRTKKTEKRTKKTSRVT